MTAQFPQAELQLAAYCATEENSGAASTQYFTLDDSQENQIISDKVIFEHTTVQSIELSIDTCMWVPHTCDVQLGLYDVDTGSAWYYEFSGGSVSGTYSFPDMPEGNYIVFVRNVSSSTITDGSIRYSVS